jgi:hypothetical protein
VRALLCPLALSCVFAAGGTPLHAAPSLPAIAPLVISEIMFNPGGDENAREFVEIFNRSNAPVSLEGFRIGDSSALDIVVPAEGGGWIIAAGEYAILFDPDYFSSDEPYFLIPQGAPLFTVTDRAIGSRGLSNSTPETVYLVSAGGDTLSAVKYSIDCPPGHSWERVDPFGGDSPDNFRPSRETDGTPGRRNSLTPPEVNPALESGSIRFDSSTVRMGGALDLFISCRNGGLEPIAGVSVSVILLPDITVGTATFGEEIPPGERSSERTLIIPALPGGRLTLRALILDSGGAGAEDDTAFVRLDVPVTDGALILNEVMAAPREGPEWIELANTASQPVCLDGWRIGDSAGGRSDELGGRRFLPPGGFGIVSAGEGAPETPPGTPILVSGRFPALNNDSDTAFLIDPSGAVRDSVSWTQAASGVSIELISPNLRGKNHAWDVSVDPAGSTPGGANSIRFDPGGSGSGASSTPSLTVSPNPFEGETRISYRLSFPLARVRIEVYDRSGRRTAVLREASESGSEWSMTWNGRWGGKRLPAGAYILSFEALDRLTGKTVTIRKPIVIARKL